jgi:uncharacterized NAD(P)/FAD-binding protein YdhS
LLEHVAQALAVPLVHDAFALGGAERVEDDRIAATGSGLTAAETVAAMRSVNASTSVPSPSRRARTNSAAACVSVQSLLKPPASLNACTSDRSIVSP